MPNSSEEESLLALTSIFDDPWTEEILLCVLRRKGGDARAAAASILDHGDGEPRGLLERLEEQQHREQNAGNAQEMPGGGPAEDKDKDGGAVSRVEQLPATAPLSPPSFWSAEEEEKPRDDENVLLDPGQQQDVEYVPSAVASDPTPEGAAARPGALAVGGNADDDVVGAVGDGASRQSVYRAHAVAVNDATVSARLVVADDLNPEQQQQRVVQQPAMCCVFAIPYLCTVQIPATRQSFVGGILLLGAVAAAAILGVMASNGSLGGSAMNADSQSTGAGLDSDPQIVSAALITEAPTRTPTPTPTISPTPAFRPAPLELVDQPTGRPAGQPTSTFEPSQSTETDAPAISIFPASSPTKGPAESTTPTNPPATGRPTLKPTSVPTRKPTSSPTSSPTYGPTYGPTPSPTSEPTPKIGPVGVQRCDPCEWVQVGPAIVGGGGVNDEYDDEGGLFLSLSADFDRVAVSDPYQEFEDSDGENYGIAVVYDLVWDMNDDINLDLVATQVGQSFRGGARNDEVHGILSKDGRFLVVSKPGHGDGRVQLYEYESNAWIPRGGSIDGEDDGGDIGWTVEVSRDGSIMAIAADKKNNDRGQVRAYRFVNGDWSQIGQGIDGEARGDYFPQSMALSDDGETIAVGTDYHNKDSGQVRVFKMEEGGWKQMGQTLEGEKEEDRISFGLEMSAAGKTLIVGAGMGDSWNIQSIQMYSFDDNANTWVKRGGALEHGLDSVESMAISSDARRVAVGSEGNSVVKVYDFYDSDDSQEHWQQVGGDLTVESESNFGFGYGVRLSDDGTKLAVASFPLNGEELVRFFVLTNAPS